MKLQKPNEILNVLDGKRKTIHDQLVAIIAAKVIEEYRGSSVKFTVEFSSDTIGLVLSNLQQTLKESDWAISVGNSYSDQRSGTYTEISVSPIIKHNYDLVTAYYNK